MIVENLFSDWEGCQIEENSKKGNLEFIHRWLISSLVFLGVLLPLGAYISIGICGRGMEGK